MLSCPRFRRCSPEAQPAKKFQILFKVLPVLPRTDEACAYALLSTFQEVLATAPSPIHGADLLSRAVAATGHFGLVEFAKAHAASLTRLVDKTEAARRSRVIAACAGSTLRYLLKLGLGDLVGALLTRFEETLAPVKGPESLRSRAALAGG